MMIIDTGIVATVTVTDPVVLWALPLAVTAGIAALRLRVRLSTGTSPAVLSCNAILLLLYNVSNAVHWHCPASRGHWAMAALDTLTGTCTLLQVACGGIRASVKLLKDNIPK